MTYIYSGTIGSNLFLLAETTEVADGGSAVDTTIGENGVLLVDNGGIAENSVVLAGGTLSLASGAVHRGSLQIDKNAVVTVSSGAVIEFSADDKITVSGLEYISGTPDFVINVATATTSGSFTLALDISEFAGEVTIYDGEKELGKLQLDGGAVAGSEYLYSLGLENGVLSLTVAPENTGSAAKGTQLRGSANTITTNLYGDGLIAVGTEDITAKVFGGSLITSSGTVSAPGNVVVNADDGIYIKAILGGDAVSVPGGTVRITGDAAVSVDGELDGHLIFGGHFVASGAATISGNTALTINSGTFDSFVCGGNAVNTGATASLSGTSTLTINGGVFNSVIAGASMSQGGTVTYRNATITTNICGGTFNARVFGGNVASKQTYATQHGLATTLIDIKGSKSSVNINIDCTNNPIVFNDHIIAGSYKQGGITGSTTVRISGLSENLTFNHILCGDSASGGEQTNLVKGSRNLIFDNYNGAFNAEEIVGFSTLSLIGDSQLSLSNMINLASASGWTFELGSSLNWMLGTNNFRGDSMTLDFGGKTLDEEWTIISGGQTTVYAGFSSMTSVKINGETATYDNANKYYASANYKLFIENSGSNYYLKLAALA